MKHDLAFNLIAKQLEWTDADFAKEFRELQLIIDHKYDGYQGFQPATRFHVSLLNWLSQFPTLKQRKTAYRFVKQYLVFVSQREMHHLVSLMMPEVERKFHQQVAQELSIPLYETHLAVPARGRLDLLRRRTLYVGLSDGARIDVFRRYNEGRVSNEQVVAFHEIGPNKWNDLQVELRKRLTSERLEAESWFERVCLVDDFTGSGSSLIRFDPIDRRWKGKIPRFCEASRDRVGHQLAPDCIIHAHHHLASHQARQGIEERIERYNDEQSDFRFEVTFSCVLSPAVVIDDKSEDEELTQLLKEWYDAGIADDHTGPNLWYGYSNCGLPVVLEHNTPNNSIALLWAESKAGASVGMKPLFLRRKRHSSDG